MDKRTILAIFLSLIVILGTQYWQAKTMPPRKPPTPPGAAGTEAGGVTPTAGVVPTDGVAGATAPAAGTATAGAGAGAGAGSEPLAATETAELTADYPVRELTLGGREGDRLSAKLSSAGAVLVSLELKPNPPNLKTPFELLRPAPGRFPALVMRIPGERIDVDAWRIDSDSPDRVVFSRPIRSGLTVEKTISLRPGEYALDVSVRILGAAAPGTVSYTILATTGMTPEDEGHTSVPHEHGVEGTIFAVAGLADGGKVTLKSDTARDLPKPGEARREFAGNTAFGGAASKYFALVLAPIDVPAPTLFFEQLKLEIGRPRDPQFNVVAGYHVDKVRIGADQPARNDFLFFAGPKIDVVLAKYDKAQLERVLDLTSKVPGAESLSTLFLFILRFLAKLFGGYGLAIIVLTLIVRSALHPLSRASQRNMFKMQKLAPKVKEIQKRYEGKKSKDAAQKMNTEIMELYRANGASPVLGCLPMLFQFPVFIGLYNSLAYSIELRQTQFLWIHDLAKPDRIFAWGRNTLPLIGFFGDYFNLLPLLMVITMVLQSKMQPQSPDPAQREQAKLMQYMMAIFGIMFYHVAAGLVLYFLTSSLLGMAESKWIKHQIAKEEGEPAAA